MGTTAIDNLLIYLKSQLIALPIYVKWGIIGLGTIMITREVILSAWRRKRHSQATLEYSGGSVAELPASSPVDLADPMARTSRQPAPEVIERHPRR